MKIFSFAQLAAVALLVVLAGCGGGGGSSPGLSGSGPVDPGGSGDGTDGSPDTGGGATGGTDGGDPTFGISGSGRAIGVIRQGGSICVNGVRYDTSEALIVVNGVIGSEADLGVGMVVFVQGSIDEGGTTGSAEIVIVDDNLKGPISAITSATDTGGALLDARQITVLGIDVIIERTGTVFEDTTFEGLAVGDFVEVYGFAESGNNLRATRVEQETFIAGVTDVELFGEVVGLDRANESFNIADYTINYGTAIFDDLDEASFADGLLIEVKGTLAAVDSLIIDASKIEPIGIDAGEAEDDGDVDVDTSLGDDDELSIAGAISNYDAAAQTFVINGITIDASAAELSPSTLMLEDGVIVKVEGIVSDGILIANEVESRRGRIEIEARVSALDAVDQLVTLDLGVGVLDVAVTADTLMDDDRETGDDRLNFEDLLVGDSLEIEAIDIDGALVATRVDREDEADEEEEISIQAPVDGFVAEQSITLLGLQFAVDQNTEYESIGGSEVGAAAFFAQISSGFLVKLEDEDPLDGTADELEFEDPRRPDGGYEFDDDDELDDDDEVDHDDSCDESSSDSEDESDSSDSSDSSNADSDDTTSSENEACTAPVN